MYQITISAEEIGALPLASFPGKIQVVDKLDDSFFQAVRYLKKQKVLGFDTETRPCFSPGQRQYPTALIQLSGEDKAFLFRINIIGIPAKLCSILADPGILKIGAATGGDITGLYHRAGFHAAGFVDLQKMVWEWGIRDKAVKKMAAIILGVKISKAMQLSNWEADVLSPAQQLYAATDAWICREMYLKLQQEEKHPLTLEQRDPEHYAALQARKARIAAEEERLRIMREKKLAAKAARMAAHEAAVAAARAQKKNRRHRRRRKKSKANGENLS